MNKKVYLSWEDVYGLLDKIYAQIEEPVDYVTGIPRGGTILAILYSHRFGTKYKELTSKHPPRLLVIDDIADSGKTLFELRETMSDCKFATLHYKLSSIVKPDYFAEELQDTSGWIVYPWEKKDSKEIQDYLDI